MEIKKFKMKVRKCKKNKYGRNLKFKLKENKNSEKVKNKKWDTNEVTK